MTDVTDHRATPIVIITYFFKSRTVASENIQAIKH